MQAWIEGLEYQLGPPMLAKPSDERCVIRCRRECSLLPPEVQPPMRTFRSFRPMSALPPKADVVTQSRNVRFVPNSEILGLQPLSGGRWLARLHNPLSGQTHRG